MKPNHEIEKEPENLHPGQPVNVDGIDYEKRYVETIREVRKERGEFCELCKTPTRHAHHMIPCSTLKITAELVFMKENLIMLCNYCHSLMHPGIRNPDMWKFAGSIRAKQLKQASGRKA